MNKEKFLKRCEAQYDSFYRLELEDICMASLCLEYVMRKQLGQDTSEIYNNIQALSNGKKGYSNQAIYRPWNFFLRLKENCKECAENHKKDDFKFCDHRDKIPF